MDKVPVFYLFLHRKLCLTTRKNCKVSIKNVMQIVGRAYNIPKHVMYCIIKELEGYGLVRVHNRLSMEITNHEASVIIDDKSSLYREVGINND